MIHMKERNGLICVMLGIAVVLAGGRSARADDFEKFQERARQQKKDLISKLMDQHAACIVTVEFIAKESFMGQERKSEMESLAVMVSPDGLVLAANSRLQGLMSMGMRMAGGMMGGMMGSMPPPQSDTEDLKIIIGDDDSEKYEAKLIARDSDLDLAWVQITDTKGQTFKYVDFQDSVQLEVGDSYYTISRMGERFDRVPLVSSSSIAAVVQNPRPLLVGSGMTPWGGPVFGPDGKVAGFVVTQPPEPGEEGAMSLESMMNMGGFILPAKKIVKAMEQAREIAKKQPAEDDEDAESGDSP
ncbi:MAG: trypsin-like peptidase domain-containing protein [Planctomycetes bacterium]|nr:trypsin-like peptidase domain-containing protein [Planctomycetota bacterium]